MPVTLSHVTSTVHDELATRWIVSSTRRIAGLCPMILPRLVGRSVGRMTCTVGASGSITGGCHGFAHRVGLLGMVDVGFMTNAVPVPINDST